MEARSEYLGGRLKAAVGDITLFRGDAIVNAANSGLLGGGGVDGAIHRAAGPGLSAECRELRRTSLPEGLPAGQAVATGAGLLPLKGVIHAVGPVWRGGGAGERELLASAYAACLDIASGRGWDRVAFPAISTGVYGYPRDEAARVAFSAARDFAARRELPSELWFVFYSEGDYAAFESAVRGLASGTAQ